MVDVNRDTCDLCGTCISVCRSDALVLTESLTVDREACVGCGLCVRVCPVAALTLVKDGSGDGGDA